jgi:hypothetical protein
VLFAFASGRHLVGIRAEDDLIAPPNASYPFKAPSDCREGVYCDPGLTDCEYYVTWFSQVITLNASNPIFSFQYGGDYHCDGASGGMYSTQSTIIYPNDHDLPECGLANQTSFVSIQEDIDWFRCVVTTSFKTQTPCTLMIDYRGCGSYIDGP